MKNIGTYSDNELSLQVFNDEYFYNELIQRESYTFDYVIALVNEEFYYTAEQMAVLKKDIKEFLNGK